MARRNNVAIFEPEKMGQRLDAMGYTYYSYSRYVLERCVSATTLERMSQSGYASRDSVRKITEKSPDLGPYILFGVPVAGRTTSENLDLPEDVSLMLAGMSSYIKVTSWHRNISVTRLMLELEELVRSENDGQTR